MADNTVNSSWSARGPRRARRRRSPAAARVAACRRVRCRAGGGAPPPRRGAGRAGLRSPSALRLRPARGCARGVAPWPPPAPRPASPARRPRGRSGAGWRRPAVGPPSRSAPRRLARSSGALPRSARRAAAGSVAPARGGPVAARRPRPVAAPRPGRPLARARRPAAALARPGPGGGWLVGRPRRSRPSGVAVWVPAVRGSRLLAAPPRAPCFRSWPGAAVGAGHGE